MMNKLLIALTATAALTCIDAWAAHRLPNGTTTVAGTTLASLHSAHDVLVQLPGVSFKNDEFSVTGRGVPEIYIGKRKVGYVTELKNMPASFIKEVSVITEPNAEYGKNVQSVIIINLVDDQTEGLKLDNNLSFKYNSFLAPSDQLTVYYKRYNYQFGGQLGITEARSKQEVLNFTNNYRIQGGNTSVLSNQQHESVTPYKHGQTLSAKVFGSYNINMDHKLSASYFADWQRRNDTHKWDDVTCTYAAKDGVLDMSNPIECDTTHFRGSDPTAHHEVNVEYQGKVGNVTLTAGNNTFWNRSFDKGFKYAVTNNTEGDCISNEINYKHERVTRTYAIASMPLYKGAISAGVDFIMRRTDARLNDILKERDGTHGITKEHTYAGYFDAMQEIGQWSFGAGLRYENVGFNYQACDDDEGLIASGFDQVAFDRKYSHLYPNAMAAVKLGNSKLTLSFARSYNQMNMANIKVHISGSFRVDDYMLLTERINTTSLTWDWKWLSLNATHRRYNDPLCHTTNGNVDYNGKDYDALDINLNLTPKIGVWNPAFTFHAHKQWFTLDLVDGRTSLNTPVFEVQLYNTFVLPNNWSVRLNGDWRTKGYDRNVRYYKHNFQLDAAIQKTLLNNKLTVELQGNNLLYDSWDNVSIYTDYHQKANKGHKNRIERNVILSLRYSL